MEIHSSKIPLRPLAAPGLSPKGERKVGQQDDTFTSGRSTRIQKQWESLPDVRPEVVERAKEALARGDYSKRDVIEKTAGRIAGELFRSERKDP